MRYRVATIFMCLPIALLAASVGGSASGSDYHIYCSVTGQQAIVQLRLDSESGTLRSEHRIGTPGEPGALTVTDDGRFLYASMRSTGRLCSFAVDSASGQLSLLNAVDVGADPAHVSVAPGGRFLFSAYYVEGGVAVHRIERDGTLSQQALQWVPTEQRAHAIAADATGRYVFVPHTSPNRIYQFRFDADSGLLSAAEPAFLQRPENTGPRHLTWAPMAPVMFVDNEQGSSVTSYRMDDQGQLTALSTATSLPEDAAVRQNSNAEVLVHPRGRWLYVANRGHDSIALISVSEAGSRLKFEGAFATQQTPRSFSVTADGRWLLAAGQASGNLEVYRIDPDNGGLTSVGVARVGTQLWWVTTHPAE